MAVLFSMPKPKLLVFYVPNLLPVWGKQLAIRSLARRPHESTRSHAVGFPIAETQGISWVQDVLCLGTLVFVQRSCAPHVLEAGPIYDLQPWKRRNSSELAYWGVGDLCFSRDGNSVLCFLYLFTDTGKQRSKAF